VTSASWLVACCVLALPAGSQTVPGMTFTVTITHRAPGTTTRTLIAKGLVARGRARIDVRSTDIPGFPLRVSDVMIYDDTDWVVVRPSTGAAMVSAPDLTDSAFAVQFAGGADLKSLNARITAHADEASADRLALDTIAGYPAQHVRVARAFRVMMSGRGRDLPVGDDRTITDYWLANVPGLPSLPIDRLRRSFATMVLPPGVRAQVYERTAKYETLTVLRSEAVARGATFGTGMGPSTTRIEITDIAPADVDAAALVVGPDVTPSRGDLPARWRSPPK
jgi:hypothetical protein